MLPQWLTRPEDVKAHGGPGVPAERAHRGQVEVVTPSRVMVGALRRWRCSRTPRTEDDDRYESTYRARYELRKADRDAGGVRAWKIVGGSVVY